jgi:hypothetical protein
VPVLARERKKKPPRVVLARRSPVLGFRALSL